ncbi:MAG: hypothetical protein WCR06_01050 [bacterium]
MTPSLPPAATHMTRLRAMRQWLARWRMALVCWLCALLATALLVWVWLYLQPHTWRYYTDEISLRRQACRVQPQTVVWEDASRVEAPFDVARTNAAQGAFSADQQQYVFVQSGTNGSLDLFLSRRQNNGWGPAEPLRALNSPFNETDPAFSRDGKYLYFATDRPGGPGGYDIWVARWDGETFAWPLPLTSTVNSKFNDTAPAISGDRTLYFASDRPRFLKVDDRQETAATLATRYPQRDFDIFYADAVPAGVTNVESERAQSILYSLRERALSDPHVMQVLGGTKASEAAVDRALAWLAATQETNGMWSISRYDGQARHDVSSTAFALLAFYGRSERHDRPCRYQKTVRRGLQWLLDQQNPLTGDLRGPEPAENGMYDQCIGTLALAEAFGLTKDESLRQAVQSAVFFLSDSQHPTQGGWRYKPLDEPDLSVTGWGIMALKSAELSGIHVQRRSIEMWKAFLRSVAMGEFGGQFDYMPTHRKNSKAMIATGFFCSQLMGMSPNSHAAFEAASMVSTNGGLGDVYFLYYGTLSGYQFQGSHWRNWRDSIHRELLASQGADGSWMLNNGYAKYGGRIMSTALVALSLQAHYRYTPLYGLGYEPPERPVARPTLSLDDLPEMPNYYTAARFSSAINALDSDETDPAVSPHGDFLYFASNRKGGCGGFDIYRSRIATRIPAACENLGPEINTPGDEVGPDTWMQGFGLFFSRALESGKLSFELCGSMSRRVWPHYNYARMPDWSWLRERYAWQLLLAGAALITCVLSIVAAVRRRRRVRPADAPNAAADKFGFLHHLAHAAAWIVPLLLFVFAAALLIPVVLDVREKFWCFYSDDDTLRREAMDARPRQTLWSHPDTWTGLVATNAIAGGPHFTADDGHVLFAARAPGRTDTDLYQADWNGRSWSAPISLEGVNSTCDELEGVLSPDGRYLYFTSDRAGGKGLSDIWVAQRSVSNRWALLAPLGGEVNSEGDERGISLSSDGQSLYFASNRGGGRGGYDLFCATLFTPPPVERRAGSPAAAPSVVQVERLDEICSGRDDTDPALSPSGDLLYFASNRPKGHGGYDLYVSRRIRGVLETPVNAGAELNGAGDERWPALRMQGYDLAYGATAGSNALQGVSVTRREVVGEVDYARWQSFLALLSRIKWWVMAMVGSFLLLLYLIRQYRDLTNRFHKCLLASAILHAALLFILATWTITREVKTYTTNVMEMMVDKVALQEMEKEVETRKEAMALDQNKQTIPLPATVVNRMVAEQNLEPGMILEATPVSVPRATESSLTVPATPRSKEQSAVEVVPVASGQRDAPMAVQLSRQLKTLQTELQVADVDQIAMEEPPAGRIASADDARDVKLDAAVTQKSVASVFKSGAQVETKACIEKASVEEVTRALAAPEAAAPVKNVGGVASASPATAATRPVTTGEVLAFRKPTGYDVPLQDVEMEVPAMGETTTGATNAAGGAVAWGSGVSGSFDPAGGVARVGSSFQVGAGLAGGGINGPGGGGRSPGAGGGAPAGSGAGIKDVVGEGGGIAGEAGSAVSGSGGDRASAVGGTAQRATSTRSSGKPIEDGSADTVLTRLAKRGGNRAGDIRLGGPIEMEVPEEYARRHVADLFSFAGRPSQEVVEALGGSSATEGAIRGSLDWLTRNQEPDGRWSCRRHGGEDGHDVAATALALLCYYGWGMKHNVDCEYLKPVKDGMAWLLGQMKPDGDIRGAKSNTGMYDQGIAAMTLCEAYGISRDPALFLPSSNAIAFIARAQNKEGGWRYLPNATDSDMSVFGWQFMALHSARIAGIPVPSNALARADRWLDRASGGAFGGLYGYQGPNQPDRPAMTACGMFCRQLQKVPPTDDRMKETAGFLRVRPLPGNNLNLYYVYYATLALYQQQGEVWEEWNTRMKEILPQLQRKTGPEAGSWDPQGAYGNAMGRCVSTTMVALSLEVYYRFLPMFGYRSAADEGRPEPEQGRLP